MTSGRLEVSGWKRRATRFGVASQRAATRLMSSAVTFWWRCEIGGELVGIAEERVVLVQQVGLAAEAADALEAR